MAWFIGKPFATVYHDIYNRCRSHVHLVKNNWLLTMIVYIILVKLLFIHYYPSKRVSFYIYIYIFILNTVEHTVSMAVDYMCPGYY